MSFLEDIIEFIDTIKKDKDKKGGKIGEKIRDLKKVVDGSDESLKNNTPQFKQMKKNQAERKIKTLEKENNFINKNIEKKIKDYQDKLMKKSKDMISQTAKALLGFPDLF